MQKEMAIQKFWSSFGVKAYDESTVPEDAEIPRITYNIAVDSFDRPVSLTASIWDRSKSWQRVTSIKDLVAEAVGYGGTTVKYEGGMVWVKPRTPFAQRMSDPDDSIRRIVLNLEAEFI